MQYLNNDLKQTIASDGVAITQKVLLDAQVSVSLFMLSIRPHRIRDLSFDIQKPNTLLDVPFYIGGVISCYMSPFILAEITNKPSLDDLSEDQAPGWFPRLVADFAALRHTKVVVMTNNRRVWDQLLVLALDYRRHLKLIVCAILGSVTLGASESAFPVPD